MTKPQKQFCVVFMRDVVTPRTLQEWDNVPVLKVRQPYADELVNGTKDIENRTWSLRPPQGFPLWVVIASCRAMPTVRAVTDVHRRRTAAGLGPLPSGSTASKTAYAYGHIIGMVLVESCDDTHESAWYVAGHKAWVVSTAIRFAQPIPMDVDDKMQIIAYMRNRMHYREPIMRALDEWRSETTNISL